ncbi:hypothetical protein [Levilactobacillus yonginensis]
MTTSKHIVPSIIYRSSPTVDSFKKLNSTLLKRSPRSIRPHPASFNNFLSTSEAKAARKEVETGQLQLFASFAAMWADLNDED